MYHATRNYGRKGSVMAAISAIDIALWDIAGKSFGVPIYQLLGGAFRPRVQAYATGFYRIKGQGESERLGDEALGACRGWFFGNEGQAGIRLIRRHGGHERDPAVGRKSGREPDGRYQSWLWVCGCPAWVVRWNLSSFVGTKNRWSRRTTPATANYGRR